MEVETLFGFLLFDIVKKKGKVSKLVDFLRFRFAEVQNIFAAR